MPKALKKHSVGHSEPGAQKHSKSTTWGTFRPGPLSTPVNSGKEKTHKHKQICGIVPGLGGCQKFVYVFFWVVPYGGEKHIKKSPPKSWDNPVKILFTCFFFMCFFAPDKWRPGCSAFLAQKSTAEQARSSFGGLRKGVFSGTFSSSIRFAPPPPRS